MLPILADSQLAIPSLTLQDLGVLTGIVVFIWTATTWVLSLWLSGRFTKRSTYEKLHRELELRIDAHDKEFIEVKDQTAKIAVIDDRQQGVLRALATNAVTIEGLAKAVADNSGRVTEIEKEARKVAENLALTKQPVESFSTLLKDIRDLLQRHIDKTENRLTEYDRRSAEYDRRLTRIEAIEQYRKHNGKGSRSPAADNESGGQ